ncbi:hypothetical protein M409DRAFT_15939 [Zasmidium cellare ATCC 36951]|uniref:Uncharacterized protein n=1 Tax=Zasmidium cellare ATCC 36951 TaxID=1080233 RepID=A0A6A6D617_ZASCE|nr:uncharacterized protein M409DRAFT_15939 [Zasmidium cellare ATCC 36951]KAF2173662.1 hypothetical protein M409DRAFT_15939 [Zasmidium cellare ATCC 36951]
MQSFPFPNASTGSGDLPPPYSTPPMPEHSCPTAATAFKILEETRQSKDWSMDTSREGRYSIDTNLRASLITLLLSLPTSLLIPSRKTRDLPSPKHNRQAISFSNMKRSDSLESNSWTEPPPPYSSMPERICSTTAEALEIIKEQRLCPFSVFEERYGTLIDSKPAVVECRVTEIRKELEQIISADYLCYERSTRIVYAGHRFTFTDPDVGRGFHNTLQIEHDKKAKALKRRTRKLGVRMLVFDLNLLAKLKSKIEKRPLPMGDYV